MTLRVSKAQSTYLVDSDDQLGSLHSSEMLDRSRDTDSEVQLRGDDLQTKRRIGFMSGACHMLSPYRSLWKTAYLSGLSDLEVVVRVSSVDGSSGRTDSCKRERGPAVNNEPA